MSKNAQAEYRAKARFGFVEAPPIFAATQRAPSINFDDAKVRHIPYP
jgi:hypothetical protein